MKRKYVAELDRRLSVGYHMPWPPIPPYARARITATYYYPNHRHWLDPDNAMRRLKPFADWLVTRGFLAGDTAAQLEWEQPWQVVDEDNSVPELCSVRVVLQPLTPIPVRGA